MCGEDKYVLDVWRGHNDYPCSMVTIVYMLEYGYLSHLALLTVHVLYQDMHEGLLSYSFRFSQC